MGEVDFYEIQRCCRETVDGKPVLTAPVDTPLRLLTKYEFYQLSDGRWIHYLTLPEQNCLNSGGTFPSGISYIRSNSYTTPIVPVSSETEYQNKAIAGFIGLGVNLVIPGFGLIGTIVAIIMTINLRKEAPAYKPGKILLWCLIAEGILFVSGILLLGVFLLIMAPLMENFG